MTPREKIIAAAKEVDPSINDATVDFLDEDGMKKIEHFYSIAFEAGAASRDAEIAELVAALELLSKYIAYNGDDWVQRTALEALAKVRKP